MHTMLFVHYNPRHSSAIQTVTYALPEGLCSTSPTLLVSLTVDPDANRFVGEYSVWNIRSGEIKRMPALTFGPNI